MRQEQFVRRLQEVWAHGDQFHRRMVGGDDPMLAEALVELGTALEELRVTEEQLRSDEVYVSSVHSDRERYRTLFEQAPAAYLVTDRDGVVRMANLRASALLGVDRQWLTGKPLVSFVQLEDRKAFRQQLLRTDGSDGAEWNLRLRPRHGFPVRVRAHVGILRDADGRPPDLAWMLREVPASASGLADLLAPEGGQHASGGSGRPDWEALSGALQEVASSAMTVLGADCAGLMLADPHGRLGWVTATDESGRAFEQAQRDLGEGPCVIAAGDNVAVATEDVRTDPRWQRLAPVAAAHGVCGVLAVPVAIDGRAVGTCNAISRTPRRWGAADLRVMGAFALVLARLLAQAAEASQQAELVAQLRQALDSRVAIEQAKGVLIARLRVDEQAAFERLRQIARSSSRRISEVAADVVAGRLHVADPRRPADGQHH
jgi:PAS domain S-box-containing protein